MENEVPVKSIPANLEAERAVLGSLLIDPDAIIKVANFLRVEDFFREKEMAYTAQTFGTIAEAVAAYQDGKCDAYTADQSQLYAVRLKLAKPEEHVILPEVISKEPLGPAVRVGDEVHELRAMLAPLPDRLVQLEQRDPSNLSFAQAAKLVGMGATVDELTQSCGLTQAEAQLMSKLHKS